MAGRLAGRLAGRPEQIVYRTPCRTPGTNRVCMCNFFLFLIKEILLRASTARCPYPYTLLKKKFLQQKGQRTSYRSPFLRFLRNQSINKNKRKKYFFIFPSGERKRRNRRNYITDQVDLLDYISFPFILSFDQILRMLLLLLLLLQKCIVRNIPCRISDIIPT